MQLKTLWKQAADRLTLAGVSQPLMDARLLLQHVLGISYEQLLVSATRAITLAEQASFDALLARRESREPIAVILGRKAFWKHNFITSIDTLDPRPDSETIITTALKIFSDSNAALKILDVGTGTGCLMLSLLQEFPNATATALDASEAALKITRQNIAELEMDERVEVLHAPWQEATLGTYDLIVSNPPYIPSGEIDHLSPEVKYFDPKLALDGGEDGLVAYRSLAEYLPQWMKEKSVALLEIGAGQADAVTEIFTNAGMHVPLIERDLAGIPRVVVVQNKV